MSTATIPPAARPLPSIPGGAHKSFIWRDTDGVLQKHEIEMPVDKSTDRINGTVWACPAATCSSAEWVIEPAHQPKNRYCPNDGQVLVEMPLDDREADPFPAARQKMLARIGRHVADYRDQAAGAIRHGLQKQIDAARGGLSSLAGEMITPNPRKGHLPSIAATAALEIGVIYTVDLTGALESVAIGVALATWGAIIGYWLAVQSQKLSRTLRHKQALQGRNLTKARQRGLYTAKAIVGAGALFGMLGAIDGLAGLNVISIWQAPLIAALTLGLAWLVNRDHWSRLWAERRRLRDLAEQAQRKAAEDEAERLAEEAERLRQEADLREELAEVGALDPDNPEHQGELMRLEWERIGRLSTADTNFPKIRMTKIIPNRTREVLAPDPDTGKKVRIGWEYLGTCEPGALVANGGVPPIMMAREWIVSVLFNGQYDTNAISIIDKPGGQQNTFIIMITERARLGQAVPFRPETAVRTEYNGDIRYAYLGRSLTGEDIEEVLYAKSQPFGGGVTGQTGSGKGGHLTRYTLACLLAHIFPVLFDPKRLVDFADFVGLFPIGFTKRHRRMLLNFLVLERERREARVTASPKVNRYGAQVAGDSKWNTHDPATGEIGVYGQPMVNIWDEFHDLAKDNDFLLPFTNHVRFQRVAGMGSMLASQGGGLEDWGNSILRDMVMMTGRTNYRGGDMQSRMAGNKNQAYSTSDLPMLPGMCLRAAVGSPEVPLRAAYISREVDDEDTIFTTLWGKGATPVMQIDDPLNWISTETIEIMKDTGVWDLWMLAREGGLAALLADDAEDEEEDEEGNQQIAMPQPKSLRPAPATGPMQIRDILLAILHQNPTGMSRSEILASSDWVRGGRNVPDTATLTRYANQLDPTKGGTLPLPDGMSQKMDRGAGGKSWRLIEAGEPFGAQAYAELAQRPRVDGTRPLAGRVGIEQPAPVQTAVIEMAAQRAAELATMIAQEQAMVRR